MSRVVRISDVSTPDLVRSRCNGQTVAPQCSNSHEISGIENSDGRSARCNWLVGARPSARGQISWFATTPLVGEIVVVRLGLDGNSFVRSAVNLDPLACQREHHAERRAICRFATLTQAISEHE